MRLAALPLSLFLLNFAFIFFLFKYLHTLHAVRLLVLILQNKLNAELVLAVCFYLANFSMVILFFFLSRRLMVKKLGNFGQRSV
jgi:hypothetical protein